MATKNRTSGVNLSGSVTVSIPSGWSIASGDLLAICLNIADDGVEPTAPSGWTLEVNQTEGSTLARDTRLQVYWKEADGTEAGTDVTFGDPDPGHATWTLHQDEDNEDPATQAPDASTATGNDASPDPPSHSPAGGSGDYLSLAIAGQAAETALSSGDEPTNYSNLVSETAGTQNAEDETTIMVAERELTGVSSENPGAFSSPTSQRWVSATFMVPRTTSTTSSLPILTPPAIGG